jgi:phage tail sheath gpL-like
MPIYVPGVPTTVRRPGYFFAVVPGGGAGPGTALPKLLLFGNMIATALTGAAPSFTTAAGTRQTSGTANETAILIGPASEAATYFGRGSQLHRMAQIVRAVDPNGDAFELWACPVAEASNTKASATLTFVGSATSSGTLRVVVAGTSFDVAITSGDSVTAMATAVATAIVGSYADLPVTAQFNVGVCTVTAKNGGPNGNSIAFRAYFVNGNALTAIGTSTSGFGTAATITGSGRLASGATADVYTNALAATATERYHRIACSAPSTDTTNLALVVAAMVSKAAATSMRWEQAVAGSISTPATAVSNATTLLSERLQIACGENNDLPPGEIAAAVAAARLAGDARFTSNPVLGETSDPGCNLNGLQLPVPVPPTPATDYPTDAEVENMCRGGVAPLVPSPGRPGWMELATSLTTRFRDADGNTDYSVGKTKVMTVLDDAAEFIRDDFAGRYRGFRLAPDPAGDAPIDVPRVLTPNIARDRVLALLAQKEGDGTVINVTALEGELRVAINATNKSRLDMDIPVEPIPDLDQVAAVIRQRSA